MRRKTRVVSVRLNEQLYNILKNITNELNSRTGNMNERYSIGDTIRLMVQYFNMALLLGKWAEPLPQLRKEFIDYLEGIGRKKMKIIDDKT